MPLVSGGGAAGRLREGPTCSSENCNTFPPNMIGSVRSSNFPASYKREVVSLGFRGACERNTDSRIFKFDHCLVQSSEDLSSFHERMFFQELMK